jgi:hypothetical protein
LGNISPSSLSKAKIGNAIYKGSLHFLLPSSLSTPQRLPFSVNLLAHFSPLSLLLLLFLPFFPVDAVGLALVDESAPVAFVAFPALEVVLAETDDAITEAAA